MDKKFRKTWKNADFIKKCLNSSYQNVENNFIVTRNYTVPYHQTLKDITWLMRLEKLKKNDKYLQQTWEKNAKISIILRVCSSSKEFGYVSRGFNLCPFSVVVFFQLLQ